MIILAIIKGNGREVLDACKSRGIEAKFIRTDTFGSTHVEIDERFAGEIGSWFLEYPRNVGSTGYPIGTLLFFSKSSTEA